MRNPGTYAGILLLYGLPRSVLHPLRGTEWGAQSGCGVPPQFRYSEYSSFLLRRDAAATLAPINFLL